MFKIKNLPTYGIFSLFLCGLLAHADGTKSAHHSTHHSGTKTGVGLLDSATITNIQAALNERGFSNPTNGGMNPETQAAIMSFQKANNLAPTGQPNKETLKALGVTATGSQTDR